MKFGHTLRKLREEKDISQVELAKKLNITSQSLSQYELNKRIPDIEMINRLADFFDVSVDYLLGRTDIKQPIKDIIKNQKKYNGSSDEISKEIRNLSPESQEELKKLIELYKIRDMQDRNSELSDELSNTD
ncbi:helix-turn-helix domain-containing protein [Alkaliphilus sp. MSJ-5]|uniref:Helix-turn-helix domain-containing protein n=1 Tax=Alkaliphilus flagellatus TaxID=2841507 RepID=A0ABS6G2W1_9FIRM|nr:helix-turn-helix transcriptional regulator [Alkaliphilus flagellatus]MBU5676809.1 helix-turn-helix domain-containing protein [Alkaliphilus flagellatus]